MCGRFILKTPAQDLAETFGATLFPPLAPRYNIAPTQPVLIVRASVEAGAREASMVRWGLVPSWSKEIRSAPLINARSETAATKPSFRSAFRRRRCLIPTDGFYEWRAEGKRRQPLHIRLRDSRSFAFAGLWESWQAPDGEIVESCVILTTEANELMRTIHDRMPVILDPTDYEPWLDPTAQQSESVQPLLRQFPAERMEAYEVATVVNNARNETPACIDPAQ